MSKPIARSKGLSGNVAAYVVAAVVVIVVVLMALYGRSSQKSIVVELDPNMFALSAPALCPMDLDKVTKMSVTIAGQTMVAEQRGNTWMLLEPINDQADSETVRRVIGMFSAIASDEVIDQPQSLAAYGLNRPFAEASFVEDGVTKTFTIGREGRTEIYYVKTSASDDLYLVRGLPEELKGLRPIDLVNSQLLVFNPDDVVKITAKAVDSDGEEIVRAVERRDGRWFNAGGDPGIVFDVELLLRDLRYVSVADVLSTRGTGLNPGTNLHLELTLSDGTKKVLDVGDKYGDRRLYFVKSSDRPHTYAVAEFIAQNLKDKLKRVGTDMMGLDPNRVVSLTVTRSDESGKPVERKFNKDSEGWSAEGKVAFSVGGVMDAIVGVIAISFAPDSNDADFGFYPAQNATQIVTTLDNKATIRLDLGGVTPDGKYRYVKSSTREGVFLAPVADIEEIVTALSRVRSELMVFDQAAVTSIAYSESDYSGHTTTKTLLKQGGKWMYEGSERNEANVTRFLQSLRNLGADKIAPIMDEADYGFYPAANTWRVELTASDGSKVALETGGTKSEGSGWFRITNYYVRVSDMTDVVLIGEFEIGDIKNALLALFR